MKRKRITFVALPVLLLLLLLSAVAYAVSRTFFKNLLIAGVGSGLLALGIGFTYVLTGDGSDRSEERAEQWEGTTTSGEDDERDQTRELQRKVEEKTKELEQFVYAASHDLSEPLRHIQGFTGILKKQLEATDRPVSDDVRETMEDIIQASEHLQRLTDSLLRLSRVSKKDLVLDTFPLEEVTEQALEHVSDPIREKDVHVESDDLPRVTANHELITVLYQNLISNAVKYASLEEEMTPEIRLTASKQNDTWVLGVRDNGVGLNEEQQKKIFQPFQRVHHRENIDGCGIGLSICKKIVERHGGEIWVESEPGEGAHFRFTLQ